MWLDDNPIVVGGLHALTGAKRAKEWTRFLGVAGLRMKKDGGGILALVDGDADQFEGDPFCPGKSARLLVSRGQPIGAGALFSLACVFARQEFESWLIGGIESLSGKTVPPDNRPLVRAGTQYDVADPEQAPRGAKQWLGARMAGGYKETTDQAALTRLVDLAEIRSRGLRSFQCLERAIDRLIDAFRKDVRVLSPMP
jgi:hypothetical protein